MVGWAATKFFKLRIIRIVRLEQYQVSARVNLGNRWFSFKLKEG
jgi:hypothetical protein